MKLNLLPTDSDTDQLGQLHSTSQLALKSAISPTHAVTCIAKKKWQGGDRERERVKGVGPFLNHV